MNKRIQYRQMENLLKKMNEKIDSQNRKIESQSEILQEFIGLLNVKQREGEDFEKFLTLCALAALLCKALRPPCPWGPFRP